MYLRFRFFSCLHQCIGKTFVGTGMLRLERGGFIQICDGSFYVMDMQAELAPVVHGFKLIGAEFDGLVQAYSGYSSRALS